MDHNTNETTQNNATEPNDNNATTSSQGTPHKKPNNNTPTTKKNRIPDIDPSDQPAEEKPGWIQVIKNCIKKNKGIAIFSVAYLAIAIGVTLFFIRMWETKGDQGNIVLLISAILAAIGWLAEQGVKLRKIKDRETKKYWFPERLANLSEPMALASAIAGSIAVLGA